jgi:protein-disulfide isomerase
MTRPLAAQTAGVEGATESPVKVLIYEDLQCPDCADFRAMLDKNLLPRFGSTVRFEHRDFPLAKHAWARQAAIAARFFEEIQAGLGIVYRKYALANLGNINLNNFNERLSQFAQAHGVDSARAITALKDKRLAALVEDDFQEGMARGIAKTPTILVIGTPFIEAFTFEEVARAINAELAASK